MNNKVVIGGNLKLKNVVSGQAKLNNVISGTPKSIIQVNGKGSGLTDAVKVALLNCFQHVAWVDEDGQDYYDALYDALYAKTVVSISAVFEQGAAVIYEDDTLDDLKQYLTVTATYDDASTAVVTGYTLSGTLTAGTSTITATYEGKKAYFDVVVTEHAVLSSISAVYTQSGTVYDTDTLDSLKADLVVTAVYSDSTTETVPAQDYTLSGTLTEGTSTITVTYSDKTTTFTVTVTHDSKVMLYNWDFTQSLTDTVQSAVATIDSMVPTKPTRDSDGVHITAASEFINLGQIYDTGITVEVDFGTMDRKGTQNGRLLMVGDQASGGLGTGFIYRNNNTWNWYVSGSWDTAVSGTTDSNLFSNKTLKTVFDASGHMAVYCDGTLIGTSTRTFTTSAGTYIQIGAYSGTGGHTCYYDMIVKAVRVYTEE